MPSATNPAPSAHYRAELKAISRSNRAGERRRSIISAVAYGARSTVPDRRQDKVWSYTRKRDLKFSEIFAPPNAPPWATDRAELWNRVDTAEKRKDANTGRELILSLPRQLDRPAQIAALREFAAREILARGLAADINLHTPKAFDGQPNDHAHVFFHTRAFDGGGFARKKLAWLSNPTDAAAEMEALRASWADCLNRQLELARQNVRVSHLSNAAQAALADSVAGDAARPLSERTAAARALDDLNRLVEPKIGHTHVAQARREVRSARRREGREIALTDQLAATSTVAAQVIDLRAERAERRAETAKALKWTSGDDARLEKAKAPAPPKARKPRKYRPSEIRRAREKLAADRARLDDAGQRLNTVIDRKIETVSADVGRTWAEIVAFCRQIAETESKEKAGAEAKAKAEREQQERQLKEATRRQASLASAAPKVPKPPAAERRAAEALDQKLRKDRPAREAAERRLRDLGATIEHGDGRTVILAESVNAVAGYDAMIQPSKRALIVPAAARAAEPTLLRAFFNWEILSAKEAGRRIVALINKGTTAFAAWVHEVAPHAEQIQPPQGAETWESLAPRRGSGDDSGGDFDVDRDDDDFRPA